MICWEVVKTLYKLYFLNGHLTSYIENTKNCWPWVSPFFSLSPEHLPLGIYFFLNFGTLGILIRIFSYVLKLWLVMVELVRLISINHRYLEHRDSLKKSLTTTDFIVHCCFLFRLLRKPFIFLFKAFTLFSCFSPLWSQYSA